MKITHETWGGIPLLHVVEEENAQSDLPIVIFLHGFTSAKEHNLHYAYNMAGNGLRVLLPEAHLHGERQEDLDEVQLSLRFWEIVVTSIEEVGRLRKEIEGRKLQKQKRIGIAGTSMGGITAFGCLTEYPWIDAAAIMMGAPNFVQLAKGQMAQFENRGYKLPITDEQRKNLLDTLAHFDLTKHSAALAQRPVFFWHGKQDTMVPYEPSFHFYEAAKKDYESCPERFEWMADDHAGHAVSRAGMLRAVNWMASHLNDEAQLCYDEGIN